MEIKTGTVEDVPALIRAMEVIHEESIYRNIVINYEKAFQFLSFCMSSPQHVCFLQYNNERNIDGALIGYIQEYFFSNELGAWDVIFFVSPERRGSSLAFQLWQSFRVWADGAGAQTLWLGHSTGITPDRTRRFYAGLGMVEVGSLFRMSLSSNMEHIAAQPT